MICKGRANHGLGRANAPPPSKGNPDSTLTDKLVTTLPEQLMVGFGGNYIFQMVQKCSNHFVEPCG